MESNRDDEEAGIPRTTGLTRRVSSRQKRESMKQAQRSRTHSNGSTLGAFYQGDAPAPAPAHSGPRRRRSSRKPKESQATTLGQGVPRPPKSSMTPPTTSGTGSDLGDLASMAMVGLGDEDISELLGGSVSPSKSKSRRPPPSSAGNQKLRGNPPTTGAQQLPTIRDDTEHHGADGMRIELVGGIPAMSGSTGVSRSSVRTVDSLRVSDASTASENIAAALSNVDIDNSFFLSEASDFHATNRTVRPSLRGSSINLDDPSFPNKMNPPENFPPMVAIDSQQQSPAPSQQQEIADFSAMLHSASYGAMESSAQELSHPLKSNKQAEKVKDQGKHRLPYSTTSSDDGGASYGMLNEEEDSFIDEIDEAGSSFLGWLDPTEWLIRDLKFDSNGVPFFDDSAEWTIAGFVRHLLFNPIAPEFTSLQQFSWAVILGILMGFYTAFWKEIIEHSVDIMWKEIPEALLEWGFFTELDGAFPLYHWMWICPAFWGGLLSYIFSALPTPIPGQNEWITAVHTQGVQDSETFFLLFVLSTLGMASGLSLGPELPLVLTAGMIGSWLGIQCKQTVLQARVMNITCAGAAVGGFFGFPMAGALFVMEIPHRMGLQYFEALSPATIASIVAVICNRMVTGNDVTGYYNYPFLSNTLPSHIFSSAIAFGLFGGTVGIMYAKGVLGLKGLVHDFFHAPHDHHDDEEHVKEEAVPEQEKTPLILKGKVGEEATNKSEMSSEPPFHQNIIKGAHKCLCCVIPYEPHRALAAGVVAGGIAGVIGMFLPQVMFWGEAQLQSMIDKGRTPLPIFGREDEPTAALTANAFCLVDPEDSDAVKAGFGMGCSFAITIAKIVVTGLSLGTGIIGGHFWGPLFSGCVASHFIVDVAKWLDEKIGFGGALATYPCVAILCTMGSTHVVTFRAYTAIMLILTLTISAFDPEDTGSGHTVAVAGDYSAVFPLLVVSVYVALFLSRQTVFYSAQRSRVDISARPEVLCQPGQEGMPVVVNYPGGDDTDDEYEYDSDVSDPASYISVGDGASNENKVDLNETVTQEDIENEFNAKVGMMAKAAPPVEPPSSKNDASSSNVGRTLEAQGSRGGRLSPLPPRPKNGSGEFRASGSTNNNEAPGFGDARLDELLSKPMDNQRPPTKPRHRRIQSAPNVDFGKKERGRAGSFGGDASGSARGGSGRHVRSDSFGSQASGRAMRVTTMGTVSLDHPDLMQQALAHSATTLLVESRRTVVESRHVRHPSMPSSYRRRGHSRNNSAASIGASSTGPPLQVGGVERNGVPTNEVERAFTSAVNQQRVDGNRTLKGIHKFATGTNNGRADGST